jgi:hypothetical protein
MRYARKMEAVSAEFDYLRLPLSIRAEVKSYLDELWLRNRPPPLTGTPRYACMHAPSTV